MKTYNWYSQLKKPSWAPPAWLFRAGLDFSLYFDCRVFWQSILDGFPGTNRFSDRSTFFAEFNFQFCFYATRIWIEEQSTCGAGCSACFWNARLGNGCYLFIRALDCLYSNSISALGVICDSFPFDCDIFK